MNKQKNLSYGLLGILIFCFLADVCFIHPIKAEAAEFKMGKLSASNRVEAGKYYLWLSGNTLYASTSKTGNGKVIVESSKSIPLYQRFVTNGSVLYYSETDSNFAYIYSVKMNGKNKKLIGKVKNGYGIEGYYNGNLYVIDSKIGSMNTYRLNIKTKKWKCIQKGAAPYAQYKEYMLLLNDDLRGNAYVFNCKTEKSVKISSKVQIPGGLSFVSGKIYYSESINNSSVKIKSCSLNGKNKKTIAAKLYADHMGKITSKYVYYIKYRDNGINYDYEFYRYDIKTKKSKKISESKFQWRQ